MVWFGARKTKNGHLGGIEKLRVSVKKANKQVKTNLKTGVNVYRDLYKEERKEGSKCID